MKKACITCSDKCVFTLFVQGWEKNFCTVILEHLSKYLGSDQDVLKEQQEKY